MAKREVVVLNSHGVGQYAYADHMPVWGETLCVKNWHVAEDGGKGSNVSVALGRLGIDAAYIGKVGNDPWGDLGQKWMREANVDTTYLYRTDEVATGTGLILIGPDGRNTVIDGDSSSVKLTTEEVFTALDAMAGSTFLVTGLEIPMRVALAGARYAKSLGMITALNPSPLPETPMGSIEYIDYLFLNEFEARCLAGPGQDEAAGPRALMESVRRGCAAHTVVMTMGERGSAGLQGDAFWTVPAIPVEVCNTAGAGDGFMAATIANLVWGKSLPEAMAWAAKYAALSVTIDGTIPSYRPLDEVERFIAAL